MKIACVSLDQAWEDRASNLGQCREHAARAAALGADLVVFPEMTLTGFTMNAAAIAEPHDASPSIGALSSLAREHGVSIAFGVVLEGAARPRNSLVVVGRDGTEFGRYAKMHPFTYASEDRSYEGGEDVVVVSVDNVAIGLSICYDLRFPELYTALAPHSEVMLVIANWPALRIEHWTALRPRPLRVRRHGPRQLPRLRAQECAVHAHWHLPRTWRHRPEPHAGTDRHRRPRRPHRCRETGDRPRPDYRAFRHLSRGVEFGR